VSKIVVVSRHVAPAEAIRQYAEAKVAKLWHYYDGIQSVEVTLDVDGEKPFVEIVVSAPRRSTFVARHRDEDMHACIDQCVHKITEQLRRHKDRVRHHQGPPHGERRPPSS